MMQKAKAKKIKELIEQSADESYIQGFSDGIDFADDYELKLIVDERRGGRTVPMDIEDL